MFRARLIKPAQHRILRGYLFLPLLALLAAGLHAQTALSVSPSACVSRAGDDMRWAAPDFDPTGWNPIAQWSGVATPTSHFWLRCRVNPGALAPAVQPVLQVSGDLSYELFADGRRIGGFGNLASGAHTVGMVRTYAAPEFRDRSHPVMLALRMTFAPELDGEQALPQIDLGDAELLHGKYVAGVAGTFESQWVTWTCYALITTAGLFFFALYWFDRTQRYLLWVSLAWLTLAVLRSNELLAAASIPYPSWLEFFLYGVGQASPIFLIEFFFALSQRRVNWFFRFDQAISLLFTVCLLAAGFLPLRWGAPLHYQTEIVPWSTYLVIGTQILGCSAPYFAFAPLRALRGWRVALAAVCCLWQLLDAAYFFVQLPFLNANVLDWFLKIQPYRSVAIAAVVVCLTLLLVQRLRETNRQRAALEGEMEAARRIQQLLVPATLDVAAGWSIEAVFLPAQEVGGDFYRCRVLPNGSERVVLGDVSGKGAAAAMTAAMLLGAAEGHDDSSPAQLLAHLSRVLARSGVGGFATCLCVDLAPDGAATIANAGHLPPYRNGEEIPCDAELPLGIAPGGACSQTTLRLAPGDTLTLLSDGVVEARNTEGELFGFERTRALSARGAEQIAEAARVFGQIDDITVLTLSRQAVAEFAPSPM